MVKLLYIFVEVKDVEKQQKNYNKTMERGDCGGGILAEDMVQIKAVENVGFYTSMYTLMHGLTFHSLLCNIVFLMVQLDPQSGKSVWIFSILHLVI